MDRSSSKFKLKRWQKGSLAVAVLLVLYTVIGFLIVPPIVRSQAARILSEQTGLVATIEKVRINPYTLTAEVTGLKAGPEGVDDWLSLQRFYANLQLSSVFRGAFVLREVTVEQPEVLVHWDEQGQLNLLTLAERFPASTNSEPSALPSAFISSIAVSNAAVRWRDDFLSPGFSAEIANADLNLTNFHTLSTNAFRLTALLDGDTQIETEGEFALQPVSATVSAGLQNLQLSKYTNYVPEWSPLTVGSGTVGGHVSVVASIGEESFDLRVTDGSGSVENFTLMARDRTEPVLQFDSVEAESLSASLTDRHASLQSLVVDTAGLAASRSADGAIDWQVWIQQILERIPASTNEPAAPSQPFTWVLKQFTVTNSFVRIEDAVPAESVSLGVTNTWVSIENLTNDFSSPLPVSLGFELATGGKGTVTGRVVPMPLAADMALDIDSVFFPIAQPYTADLLKMVLKDGTVSVDGDATARLAEDGNLRASFVGNVEVDGVAVDEFDTGMPFTSVEHVRVERVELDWPVDRIKVKSITVNSPKVHLYLREDGSANVEEMVPQQITEVIYDKIRQTWNQLQFELDLLQSTNGVAVLEDLSVSPAFKTEVTDIDVKVEGVKPNPEQPATATVAGKINGSGPFSVTAEVLPVGTNITAKVAVLTQAVGVPPGSPYAGKFVGYLIDQGRVSMDLRYELDHMTIKGQNKIIVHDFEFGQKVESEEAVNLPVKMGVSLLKDSEGKIELDVPIEGDLANPEFKLGKVIWSTFANIFTKAMTSPFKFLGSLVGAGEEEDLSQIQFEPGSSELADAQRRKAEKLSRALKQRPQLRLEIVGSYDPNADSASVKKEIFESALQEFQSTLSTNETISQLAGRMGLATGEISRPNLIKLFYIDTYEIPVTYTTNTPPDQLALAVLEARTEESEPENDSSVNGEDSGEEQKSFWQRTRSFLGLTGSKKNTEATGDTEQEEAASPAAASATARIISPDQPEPVLPDLPSTVEMEEQLIDRQTAPPEKLEALADQRAQAVMEALSQLPDLDPGRLEVKEELSSSEPKPGLPAVYLGLY